MKVPKTFLEFQEMFPDEEACWAHHEAARNALLFGFRLEPWTYFKHFALCDEANASRVRGALQSAGLLVGGTGDRDLGARKRRVWFTLPDYPVDGPQRNNRWPSD